MKEVSARHRGETPVLDYPPVSLLAKLLQHSQQHLIVAPQRVDVLALGLVWVLEHIRKR